MVLSDQTVARSAPLPTPREVRSVIPEDCFRISTVRSLLHLALSVAVVAGLTAAAATWIPMTWIWTPVWLAYAAVAGTAATGLWVIAHECGHGAFSTNTRLQDAVGFTLHSLLLVPFYSWQRSHSVHHANTNHLELGETHVPMRATDPGAHSEARFRDRVGDDTFAVLTIARSLLLGWPSYLLTGATGSPVRGRSNHFWPYGRFENDLFPPRLHRKIWWSTTGVLAVIAGLVAWGAAAGPAPVLFLYVGPYLVVNCWLVGYTWLQHTDVDIPHYTAEEWSWMLGVFQTVDRPYGWVGDVLHHRIGSTHVAHHFDHKIPHYRAKAATDALAAAYPDWYRFDPTPVREALWRIGHHCLAVRETPDGWYYTDFRD